MPPTSTPTSTPSGRARRANLAVGLAVIAGVLCVVSAVLPAPGAGAASSGAPTCVPGPPTVVGSGPTTLTVARSACPGSPPDVGYRISVRAVAPGNPTSSVDLPASQTQRTVAGLVAGRVYRARVMSRSWFGLGPSSVETAPALPPFASLPAFADREYRDFAGRPPTAAESARWAAPLEAGTLAPANAVSLAVDLPSSQAQARIIRLYLATYLRLPHLADLTHWTERARAGVTLAAIADGLASSPEARTRYGALGNRAFVTAVYRNVLGGVADPAAMLAWTSKLDSGAVSRGRVILALSGSSAHVAATRSLVDVVDVFTGMLRRVPTAAELARWAGRTRIALIASLLGSAEYAARPGVATAAPASAPLDYDALFTRFDEPYGWTSGDGARSTPLPDGRVFWSFGDSGAGRLTATRPGSDGSIRNVDSTWLNSSVVVTRPGTDAFSSRYRWDAVNHRAASFFDPATLPAGHFYWPGAGIVEATPTGPVLQVFLYDIGTPGSAPSTGRRIATLDPRTLAVTGVGAPLPIVQYHDPASNTTGPVSFGSALLIDGGYTYVYGQWSQPGWGFNSKTIAARVPLGRLDDPRAWQFEHGDGTWSGDPAGLVAAADRATNSVIRTPRGYLMFDLDHAATGPASKTIRAYRAPSPAGPWVTATTAPVWSHVIPPDAALGLTDPYTTYLPQAHAEITDPADPARILVSWSNDLSTDWAHQSGKYGYRPRFTWMDTSDL